MHVRGTRLLMCSIAVASVLAVTACAPAASPAGSPETATGSSSEYEEVQRQVAPIYKSLYPSLTSTDLAERESTAEVRAMATERWATHDEFGGVYYDFEDDSFTIFGTSTRFAAAAEAELRAELPAGSTMRLSTAKVRWSAKELEAASAALYTALPPGHDYGATIDYVVNRVVLILPKVFAVEAVNLAKDPRYEITMVDTFQR